MSAIGNLTPSRTQQPHRDDGAGADRLAEKPPMSDSFTTVFGTRRGNGRADTEPRYLSPPASSCADVLSLAQFERRLRIRVAGALDFLDELGRVESRYTGTVCAVREPRVPFFVIDAGVSCQPMARYPQRSTPPAERGPTWQANDPGEARWRFTFTDETGAQRPAPPEHAVRRPRSMRLTDAARWSINDQLDDVLDGMFFTFVVAWRHFTPGKPGDPVFGWTTRAVENRYWSFVALPAGRGARTGRPERYRLLSDAVSRHALPKDARARALRLQRAWDDGRREW